MTTANKYTTNSFSKGLVMDAHPMNTPQTVLTNALNATLVTKNVNEVILQNDMGNGRVYSAFLPNGYIPLGTKEYGGIIYIVSKNPITQNCQIGSFPSPQRLDPNYYIGKKIQQISHDDFGPEEKDNDFDGYTIHNKIVSGIFTDPNDNEIVFGAGDEFVVNVTYSEEKNGEGSSNFMRNFVSYYGDNQKKFITLTHKVIKNTKLTTLQDLMEFENERTK